MSDEERKTLRELMDDDLDVSVLRRFIHRVWGIFRHSKGEKGARLRLAKLNLRPNFATGVDFALRPVVLSCCHLGKWDTRWENHWALRSARCVM